MRKILTLLLLAILLIAPISFAQETQEEQASQDAPQAPQEQEQPSPSVEEQGQESFQEPPEPMQEPSTKEQFFGEEKIPEGCEKIKTDSGAEQVKCGFDKKEFEEFNIKDKIEKCDGEFKMIEGQPSCIKEGKQGFGSTTCPTQQEIDDVKSKCEGSIEEFKDEGGCSAIMCIDSNFKEQYDKKINEKYKDNPLKKESIKCQKDGGKLTLIQDEPVCIAGSEKTIKTKEKLDKITSADIKQASAKLNKLDAAVGVIAEKLEPIVEDYKKQGKTEQAEAFGIINEKLKGAQEKITEIKSQISSESLTEEQRREIITSMQSLQQAIEDATTELIDGKIKSEDEATGEMFEQYNEFYGSPFKTEDELKEFAQREKDALEMVRNCDKYSPENINSFVPPDPNKAVSFAELHGLIDNKCKLVLKFPDATSVTYLLPVGIYTTFKGPDDLIKEAVECSGNCDKVTNILGKHKPENKEQACMEECIAKDCNEGPMECMAKNKAKCEDECGMKKAPSQEGMGGREGMGKEQKCITECVGPDTRCQPGAGGEQNPKCKECAEKCVGLYEGPCLSDEKLREKENECKSQCEHCYGEPVYGDSGQGYECITDMKCGDASSEWGDNPGSGPGISAQAVKETSSTNIFAKLMNWLKSIFSGKKQAEKLSPSEPASAVDIAADLAKLTKELQAVQETID